MARSVEDELVEHARGLGLCGERFGVSGSVVCDELAGHAPLAPPDWLHAESIGGPVDVRRGELYAARGLSEAWL